MPDFKLPDVGEGLTEAEIVTWKVKIGDVIKINDIIVEIETAKSLVELPSPYAGTVQALHVPEGETVPVGTPIITVGDGAAAPAPAAAAPPRRPRRPSPTPTSGWPRRPARRPSPPERSTCRTRPRPGAGRTRRWSATARAPRRSSAGRAAVAPAPRPRPVPPRSCSSRARSARAPVRRTDVVPADEPVVPATPAVHEPAAQAPAGDVRVLAKPPVRKLAKDLGVDLRTVTPTGREGTVTRDDVHAATAPESSSVRSPRRRPRLTSRGSGGSRSRACGR